jgi:hypothetical protein
MIAATPALGRQAFTNIVPSVTSGAGLPVSDNIDTTDGGTAAINS